MIAPDDEQGQAEEDDQNESGEECHGQAIQKGTG